MSVEEVRLSGEKRGNEKVVSPGGLHKLINTECTAPNLGLTYSLDLCPAMKGITRVFLLVLAGLPGLEANEPTDKDSAFYYGGKCKCSTVKSPVPYLGKPPAHHSGTAELNTGQTWKQLSQSPPVSPLWRPPLR
ncbi:hypothetical protein STEG23_034829 [Scotinomys teguina]